MSDEKSNVVNFKCKQPQENSEKLLHDEKEFVRESKEDVLTSLRQLIKMVEEDSIISVAFVTVNKNGDTGNSYMIPYWPSAVVGEIECLKFRIMHDYDL